MRVLHECCRIIDDLHELRAAIQRDGVTTTGSRGQAVAHPALITASTHRGLLGRLLGQLNLPYDDEHTMRSPAQVRAAEANKDRWGKVDRSGS